MEQTIGVFGEEMLLWIALLRQTQVRPPPEHVHKQANLLLDELQASQAAKDLPVQSADDGMFAIAALLDEIAMGLPDLRTVWANYPIQATRWTIHNAGVEVFQRLERVRQGPRSVLATYVTVLGMGFLGRYGVPGVGQDQLEQLRIDLKFDLKVDPDRDWTGGVLRPVRPENESGSGRAEESWHRSLWFGRALAILVLLVGGGTLAFVLIGNLG